MEAQRQCVNMAKGLARDGADGVVDRLRSHRIAQLRKGLHQDARNAVGDDEGDRNSDGLRDLVLRVERVDGRAVEQRERQREDLGDDERHHGEHDARFEVAAPVGPEIGEERAYRLPLRGPTMGLAGDCCGTSWRWRHGFDLSHAGFQFQGQANFRKLAWINPE